MSDNDIVKVWHPVVDVYKYDDEQTEWVVKKSGILAPQHQQFIDLGVKPYEIAHDEDNLLTTAGLTRLASLLVGAGGQALDNTHTRLGVGNSSTAEAVGQTDLQAAAGSTNRWFQVMDATFPSVAAAVMTAKATWATGDGNFVWAEWGLDVLTGAGPATSGNTVNSVLFNRKVAALGTKASGTWALTVTVTFA
jgi:hypothetical protein